MTICRFYLQGRCRYGDRCWNEHTDPSPPPQRRDQYTWVSPSANSSRNYSQAQYSKSNFSSNYRESGSRSGYDSYDECDSRGSSPIRNHNSDRYSWSSVSSGYHDQHRTVSYDRNSTPKKNTTFQVQSSNRFEALSHTNDRSRNEKDSGLLSMVKNDITEWEETHIWPFSCCSHFNDRGACMSGFVDISPEELRYRAYEAENNGAFALYTGAVAGALETIRKKWNVLKNPTSDILQSIESYHGTPDFCEENLKKLIPETGTVGTSTCGQTNIGVFPSGQASSTSPGAFSFKLAHSNSPESLGSSSAFKSVLSASNQTGSSFQAFSSSSGFGSLASSSVFASASSGSSAFGSSSKEKNNADTKTVSGTNDKSCVYTLLENLTENEKAQFSSQTFTLGKIPSRPPPIELCF